jgi:hypothetical protein
LIKIRLTFMSSINNLISNRSKVHILIDN